MIIFFVFHQGNISEPFVNADSVYKSVLSVIRLFDDQKMTVNCEEDICGLTCMYVTWRKINWLLSSIALYDSYYS